MQTKINYNKHIYKTLYYHEKKQILGKAECLAAGNFIKDLGVLSFQDKHYHFQRLISLNENVTNNVLHFFLNFHPSDNLSNTQMAEIAHEYMKEMKLAHQPYLVYRHYDTLHSHMHVVSTYIQKDGTRVNLMPGDFHHSAAITQKLEQDYHLAQTNRERTETQKQAQKIKYKEMPLMPAISNILDKVLHKYKCTHLEELNAVLRLYNLQAYRGREDSRIYQHHGLVYRPLDEHGRPMLTQIKASLFDSKPTLSYLQGQFALHQAGTQRQEHRQRVTNTLDWNMAKKSMDLPALQKALERERISMVWMDGKERRQQHVFYVDHSTGAVFAGDLLGNRYDTLALRQRLAPTQIQEEKQVLKHRQRHHHSIKHDL